MNWQKLIELFHQQYWNETIKQRLTIRCNYWCVYVCAGSVNISILSRRRNGCNVAYGHWAMCLLHSVCLINRDESLLRAFPSHQSRPDIKARLGSDLKRLTWNLPSTFHSNKTSSAGAMSPLRWKMLIHND